MAEQVGNYLEEGNSARPWISRPAIGVAIMQSERLTATTALLKAIALGDFTPPAPNEGDLLMESGDRLLLESGDILILEG